MLGSQTYPWGQWIELAQLYAKERQPEKARAASSQATKAMQDELKEASELIRQVGDLSSATENPEVGTLKLP